MVRAYVALTKPRLVELLLVTTLPTMMLAAGGFPPLWLTLAVLVAGALAAGAANAINCYLDRDIDQVMRRTATRPLPAHTVSPRNALWFGITLAVVSVGLMAAAANVLAAALTLGAILYYDLIYTWWLKRTTPHNTVLGGVSGSAPVLIGWAAVTGGLSLEAWLLFALVFLWQPPHFYALALRFRDDYAAAGVHRFLVDGPSLRGDTAAARTVGSTDVVCFGRDLEVTYRVWSPKAGYPGHSAYRDFHTWAHEVGIKPSRVTGKHIAPEDKAPYDPALAADALRLHVKDFVETVVQRLRQLRERHGRPSLVVAAFDTELFGHWWYEGPQWLEAVLRALPEAGVRVTTLRGALEAGHLGGPVELPASSWGSGKDWRVWDGEQVADMVEANAALQRRLLALPVNDAVRDPVADQAVTEALLALSSDWAFMVTKDSAADYARRRAREHTERFDRLAEALRAGHPRRTTRRALPPPPCPSGIWTRELFRTATPRR